MLAASGLACGRFGFAASAARAVDAASLDAPRTSDAAEARDTSNGRAATDVDLVDATLDVRTAEHDATNDLDASTNLDTFDAFSGTSADAPPDTGGDTAFDAFAESADSSPDVVAFDAASLPPVFQGPAYVVRTFPGSRSQITRIEVSASGDVYAAGVFRGTVDFGDGPVAAQPLGPFTENMFLIKLSGDLSTLVWRRTLRGGFQTILGTGQRLSDRSIWIAGAAGSGVTSVPSGTTAPDTDITNSSSNQSALVLAYSADGALLDTVLFPSTGGNDQAHFVTPQSGQLLVGGVYQRTFTIPPRAFTPSGVIDWGWAATYDLGTRTLATYREYRPLSSSGHVATASGSAGTYYVTGSANGTNPGGGVVATGGFVAMYDEVAGESPLRWQASARFSPGRIASSADGSKAVVLASISAVSDLAAIGADGVYGSNDVLVILADEATRGFVWARRFGGAASETPMNVRIDGDEVVVVAQTRSPLLNVVDPRGLFTIANPDSSGANNTVVMTFSINGDYLRSVRLTGSPSALGYDAFADPASTEMYVAGIASGMTASSTGTMFDAGSQSAFIVRTSSGDL